MGSTGSGRLSDYSSKPPQQEESADGGGGFSGGSPAEDPCTKAFSAVLEDVERCDYFTAEGQPPGKGVRVRIEFDTRLCAVTDDGVLVGYLPTKFNYLRSCMSQGFEYAGLVASSTQRPVLRVAVDIMPSEG